MIKADVHVCLVSEQLLPNLLPVLDSESRPKEVVLLVTPRMASEAERLSLLLREVAPITGSNKNRQEYSCCTQYVLPLTFRNSYIF